MADQDWVPSGLGYGEAPSVGLKSKYSRHVLALLTTAVLLLAGAGCASNSEKPAAVVEPASTVETAPAAAPAESTPAESANSDGPTANEVFVSPISDALGVAQDEIATGFDTYVRNVEELVQSCMTEAGFDYTQVLVGVPPPVRQAELRATLSLAQFTAEYGFGIATLFELAFKDQGVIDFVNLQFGPAPTAQRSPGEQAAYEIALNGRTTQGLTAEESQALLFDGPFAQGPLEGSCRYVGFSTAENPAAAYDGLLGLLGDEFDALGDRFDNDPRVRIGWSEWQTCMATNGHSYENRFEIFDELSARSNDIGDKFLSSRQVLTALGQMQDGNLVSMDADSRAAFLEDIGALQGFSWVPEVQAEYDKLVAFELRVAADSQDCLDEDLFSQVLFELETEFVQTHADKIALLGAADS